MTTTTASTIQQQPCQPPIPPNKLDNYGLTLLLLFFAFMFFGAYKLETKQRYYR